LRICGNHGFNGNTPINRYFGKAVPFGNNDLFGCKVINCVVYLEEQPLPYGGERWFALCPHTGRRCTALVLPPGQTHFASVKGWNVAYGSQRECPIHRGHRAIKKAQARRKALSKYTRKPTRERLLDKLIERQVFVDEQIDKVMEMVFRCDAAAGARFRSQA